MKKKSLYYLTKLLAIIPKKYFSDFDDEYSLDEEVMDCKFKLYIAMLTDSRDKNFQKHYNEFEESYNKLSLEKQEHIKNEALKIFEEQDKNNKEKEKKL